MSEFTPSVSWSDLPSLEHLLKTIDRLAVRAGRRFAPHVAQRLRDEAPGHVFPRLHRFSSERGQFEPWCGRLLRRLGLDLCRRGRSSPRDFGDVDDLGLLPSPLDDLLRRDETAELRGRLDDAHALLQGLRAEPWGRGGGDYFAVLQLHVRLVLGQRLGGLVAPLEDLWPWDEGVRRRRCAPEWPALGDLWQNLEEQSRRPSFRVSGGAVCRLAGGGVTSPRWGQWCHRARQLARRHIGPADWQQLFAPWLA